MDAATRSEAFRGLPSVEEVLQQPAAAPLAGRVPRALLLEFVRGVLAGWRAEIAAGDLDREALERRLASGALLDAVAARVEGEGGRGLRRVVNATGVILHTGLGRAPVHPEAARAMAEAAAGYCVLEVDRETGGRSRRDDRLSELLSRLTGAEAAIAVNNNAGAVLLTLNTYGSAESGGPPREVVVSRGELVEIGGSFRVPSIMERAGASLREVGTTNRTRPGDYAAAIGERTGLLMKVHTSNFRLEGFVQEVSAGELAEIGRAAGVPTAFDLGSGLLEEPGAVHPAPLCDEPRVGEAVASGVDLVLFSGDKLLGAPQAGLVLGRRAEIERLRANPTYRALRLDKVAIAGLERTLELLLDGRGAELPTRAMMARESEDLERRARELCRRLDELPALEARVVAGESRPGSGSAPGVGLKTSVVSVRREGLGAEQLARRLRLGEPPVFARIAEGRLLLDPRTLLDGEEDLLLAAFERLD